MAKFIEPWARIVSPASNEEGIALLRRIEEFSRISHRSEDLIKADSWQRFIKQVIVDRGDWSVVEHSSAQVIMRISRGIANELVRHRIASYTQESTRFVNYAKRDKEGNVVRNMEFILPERFSGEDSWDEADKTGSRMAAKNRYMQSCVRAEEDYNALLALGEKPQIARDVLPLGLASTIGMTLNLRSWRHVFMMRSTKETHEDFRRILNPLLELFKERIPIIYDDIESNLKQSVSLSKPR